MLNLILIIGFYLLVSGATPFYCPVELRFCVRSNSCIAVRFRPIFALREKIISHEILTDDAIVDKIYLYFRPVYAFEFIWSNENKVGIIEIDGLNGEISEKGVWLKDRVSKVMTRDMFFDIGGEIANGMVPGGGVVVKMIDRMTK